MTEIHDCVKALLLLASELAATVDKEMRCDQRETIDFNALREASRVIHLAMQPIANGSMGASDRTVSIAVDALVWET